MHWYLYVGVVAAGFAAGFINTVAGSGSLLTLPMLIYLGLPPTVANGTNRVGILLQNFVSTISFRQQGVLSIRQGLVPTIPAIVGWLIGARIAVNLNEQMMEQAIAFLMLVMLAVMLVKPDRWLRSHQEGAAQRIGPKEMLLFFAIGIYGGFIQAGVGVFLLAALVLGAGYDLVHANGLKVMIIFFATAFALVVFVMNGQVDWVIGLVLAVGNSLGALAASRLSVKRGAPFIRWFLIIVIVFSAADMLGVLDWIGSLF
ncbi:MAG: sulfite exporter TauE/SafE family protein [Anaerolineae bacterium]